MNEIAVESEKHIVIFLMRFDGLTLIQIIICLLIQVDKLTRKGVTVHINVVGAL